MKKRVFLSQRERNERGDRVCSLSSYIGEKKSLSPLPHYQNALTQYLKELERIPVMYWDEQKAYFQERDGARTRGDFSRAQEIENEICRGNLRFVVSIAFETYEGECRDALLDLIMAGNLELFKAAECFSLEVAKEKKSRFTSYAVWGIRRVMQAEMAFRGVQGVVRIPPDQLQKFRKIRRMKSMREQQVGGLVTTEMLAEFLNVPVELLKQFNVGTFRGISLDGSGRDKDNGRPPARSLSDHSVPRPDQGMRDELLREEIDQILKTIPEAEAEVIIQFFGLNGECPKTLQSIGDEDRRSRERIRQRKEMGLKRLRHSSRADRLRPFFHDE